MTSTTIIPSHDNVDIEMSDDMVILSQDNEMGNVSVTFHKRYARDIIEALYVALDEGEDNSFDSIFRRAMSSEAGEKAA